MRRKAEREKHPLTNRPWCRECSNLIGPDQRGVTTYFYAGDFGPLCRLACTNGRVVYVPDVTRTGRVRKGVWSTNVIRVEIRPARKAKAQKAKRRSRAGGSR